MKPLYISLEFSLILLTGTVFTWWLFHYAGLNIPPFIPHTPISTYVLNVLA